MKRQLETFKSKAKTALLFALVLAVSNACTETEEVASEAEEVAAQADTPVVSIDAALQACAQGVEPVPLGTRLELPLGASVVVHAFEKKLSYELMGTQSYGAVAEVELCAGDQLPLDTPFTGEGPFNLCMSETWEGETLTEPYPPMISPKLREPVLQSGAEDIPKEECRRGWVSFQVGEKGYPLPQLHAVIYDTSQFTDFANDHVLFAWTLD